MAVKVEVINDTIMFMGPSRQLHIGKITIVYNEEGKEIARGSEQVTYTYEIDLSKEDAEVKAVAAAVWTEDFKKSIKALDLQVPTFP